jgi:chemotaxis protein CheD
MDIPDCAGVDLSAYSVGSSGVIALYDRTVPAGGILYYMLPDSSLSPERAVTQPSIFADTGISLFVDSFIRQYKSKKENIRVFLAGGATAQTDDDTFKIGEKNIERARSILKEKGLTITAEETGDPSNRTIRFQTATGTVYVKMDADSKEIHLK